MQSPGILIHVIRISLIVLEGSFLLLTLAIRPRQSTLDDPACHIRQENAQKIKHYDMIGSLITLLLVFQRIDPNSSK